MSEARLALVIIGRNEARHLAISLPAIQQRFETIVYVDSGSSDGSQALAKKYGAVVIELDTTRGFTAARARNAGIEYLQGQASPVDLVQFIDGDCELLDSFVTQARDWLAQHPEHAVVCGRRLERYPQDSVFNLLCDIEWDTPVGEARYCGGDALMRLPALTQVGGYNPDLIAGEEPELCIRLAAAGWRIYRLDADMTLHDAAMTRVSQWWKRSMRAGYAFALGASMHGAAPVLHWVREARSNWAWGGLLVAILLLALIVSPLFLMLLSLYGLLALKIGLRFQPAHPRTLRHRLLYGMHCALGKVPQFIGQLRFLLGRMTGKGSGIIEYK